MTTLTEGRHAGEFIISEGNGWISREGVTIVTGQNLAAGTVLGKITASGKYAAYSNAASDGTEVAAGILFEAVNATGGDKKGVMIARHAEVNGDELTGNDANGTADLKALAIIVR